MAQDVAFKGSSPLWIVCHCQHHCQARKGRAPPVSGEVSPWSLWRKAASLQSNSWPPEPGFFIHWPQLGAERQSPRHGGRGEKANSMCYTQDNCSMCCWAEGSLQSQSMDIGHGPSLACIIIGVAPRGNFAASGITLLQIISYAIKKRSTLTFLFDFSTLLLTSWSSVCKSSLMCHPESWLQTWVCADFMLWSERASTS